MTYGKAGRRAGIDCITTLVDDPTRVAPPWVYQAGPSARCRCAKCLADAPLRLTPVQRPRAPGDWTAACRTAIVCSPRAHGKLLVRLVSDLSCRRRSVGEVGITLAGGGILGDLNIV